MDHQGGYGTIIGSHPEDSKVIKVDGYFDSEEYKSPTYATLGKIIHTKQRKYNKISQLPERFVHRPEMIGYDPDQPDDDDNMGYFQGSSSQVVQTAKQEKMRTMASNMPTDRVIQKKATKGIHPSLFQASDAKKT